MRSRNIEGDLVCELDKSLITRFIICVTTWYITAVVDLTGSKEITMGVVYMEDLCVIQPANIFIQNFLFCNTNLRIEKKPC